jgi:hypothetical protein
MPVTTRLVQRLHDVLGEEATDDLFGWWQETARVSRAEIREVADLYFSRFEARLEKGLAEVRAEMAGQRADLIKWMFIFWAGTVIPLAGLAIALSRV